jgi:hypothetical protein
MAKIDLKFLCADVESDFVQCRLDTNGIPFTICIKTQNGSSQNVIYLDKSTAIKFAKTLRTEINKIPS